MSTLYPNLTKAEIQMVTDFFNFVDLNKDGYVTYEELVRACSVDVNGDGVISESEKSFCIAPFVHEYGKFEKIDLKTLLSVKNSRTK